MNIKARKVVIVGGQRIPFTKSFGKYTGISNKQMLTAVLDAIASKFSLDGKTVGDVALGALLNHTKDWNLSREAVLDSTLNSLTPGYNVQRACGTSLDTVNQIVLKISAGQMESGIAGGSDTNSDLPVTFSKRFSDKLLQLKKAKSFGGKLRGFFRFSPSDLKPRIPGVIEPKTGLSMGQHTELTVKRWQISREAQDELAFASHKNAARAYSEGFYDDLITPFMNLNQDSTVRADTSMKKLSKLKPAFDQSGTGSLTAGNSSPLTDGAAAILLASEEYADKMKWQKLANLMDVQVAAIDHVEGDDLLLAPTKAVADLLKRNNIELQDFDFYEIHEAFAGQVLATLKAWEDEAYCRNILGWEKTVGSLDRTKLNVKGSSLALGHPFAATGARIVAQAAKMLNEAGKGRALVSICTAGGMGVAAIIGK